MIRATLYQCGAPECRSKAFGLEVAIGLQLLGWHVGADVRCPMHHPEGLEGAAAQSDRLQTWRTRQIRD